MGTNTICNNGVILIIAFFILQVVSVNAKLAYSTTQPQETPPLHDLPRPLPIRRPLPTQPSYPPPTTPMIPLLSPPAIPTPTQPPAIPPITQPLVPPPTSSYPPTTPPMVLPTPPSYPLIRPPPTSPTDANGRLRFPKIKKPKFIIPFIRMPMVEGFVYCNCPKWPNSFPLAGASIEISCRRNALLKAQRIAITNKEGHFNTLLPQWATSGDCTAVLGYAPRNSQCKYKTDLNGGQSGASVTNATRQPGYKIYTVGPFAFSSFPFSMC